MSSFIDLRDYADPTGTTDSAPGLNTAVQKALQDGLRLTGEGSFRLDSLVDLRSVHVDMPSATFSINHNDEVGIIIGGDSYATINPIQSIGYINTPDNFDNPSVRIVGSKNQHIYIQRANYCQIFADGNVKKDGSSAYSTMKLVRVDKIELSGENGGWINENQFFLNRTTEIRMVGDYSHNHNKFYAGTMEGNGIIDLQVGHCNSFMGLRFERSAEQSLKIFFGEKTFANDILATWQPAVLYTNIPIDSHDNIISIDDFGWQNTVRHSQEFLSDEICLLDLSESTPRFSSYLSPEYRFRQYGTDMNGVYSIEQLLDHRYKLLAKFSLVYESDYIHVGVGDQIAFNSETTSEEYTDAFRSHIYAYDNNRNLITNIDFSNNSPVSGAYLKWDNEAKYFISTKNLSSGHVNILDTTNIKYIKFCMSSGNIDPGLVFNNLCIVYRQFKRVTHSVREYHRLKGPKQKSSLLYDSSINMLKIGKGIPCFSKDLSEIQLNICRSEHFVVSINGNNLTLDETPDFIYSESANAKLVYQEADTGELSSLDISTINAKVISLANSSSLPIDIVAGSPVSVIVTVKRSL